MKPDEVAVVDSYRAAGRQYQWCGVSGDRAPVSVVGRLVLSATSRLVLGAAVAQVHPWMRVQVSEYRAGLVNYPVWWWVDPSVWRVRQATATAGGTSVSVWARPVSQTWDPGDGSDRIGCQGPGVAWHESDARTSIDEPYHTSPTCGYTYTDTHDHLRVSHTITYAVTYTAHVNGHTHTGALPAITTPATTFDYTIRETKPQLVPNP